MNRVVALPGVAVTAMEVRLNLEGKSIEGQVQAVLDLFRVKFAQLGCVYVIDDTDKPQEGG